MANEFIIRTEDLKPEEALGLYVTSEKDDEIIAQLKSHTPVVLEGSRGTGKSFLFRVCEQSQLAEFNEARVLPIYLSFIKSSFINSPNQNQFFCWMMARLCSAILRALQKKGFCIRPLSALDTLTGASGTYLDKTPLEALAEGFEQSYKQPQAVVDVSGLPTIEAFRESIQDICEELNITRFNVFFDEAAHIFRPEQQRQFFTLFRDLRYPYMTCNAAVYPGVTAYGTVFETTHDANKQELTRDILSKYYLSQMRGIVARQSDSKQQLEIEKNGETFDALSFAVTGNPRLLLKIVADAPNLKTSSVQNLIKAFFRTPIWAEHSSLAERYPGHRELIDWGRTFIETVAIPEIRRRNESWRKEGKSVRSSVFWIHRDAPEAVKEALRLLTYTGIINKIDEGVKGTRSQIGTRYLVNIGCLAALEVTPIAFINELRSGFSIKRFTEFGRDHQAFVTMEKLFGSAVEADLSVNLQILLKRDVGTLDLTTHQLSSLRSISCDTIGEALNGSEEFFQQAPYVGPVRARRIKNIVNAAALEYLSG